MQSVLGIRKILAFGLMGAIGGLVFALILGEGLLALTLPPASEPQVDVLFVLDVTGSMQREIDGVRDGIRRFAGELTGKHLDTHVGLIAFRDRKIGEEPEVLSFRDGPFTADYDAFRERVGDLRAQGGGDDPESSLDALNLAARQPFRSDAVKVAVLITDAPPHVPDVETASVEDAARALLRARVNQLHLVIQDGDRPAYSGLQTGVPGRIFSLAEAAAGRQGFDQVLPEVGKQIADAALVQSRASTPGLGGSADRFVRLMLATGLWTGVLAVGIFLALILGQSLYLHRRLPLASQAAGGAAGSVIAGIAAGVAGQLLYAGAQHIPALEVVGRITGWSLLGGLLGGGMAYFIPNLPLPRAVLGGTVGGAAGAMGFLMAAGALGDTSGRLTGAALLGFFIGVMVVLIEIAFRKAWLEISYGSKETRMVNLGAEPVSIGGNPNACTIYVAGAPAIAYRYRLDNGAVLCDDLTANRTMQVQPGDRKAVGKATVTVCSSSKVERPISGSSQGGQPPRIGPAPFHLRLSTGGSVALDDGVKLGEETVPSLRPGSGDGVVAEVSRNPNNPTVLGLRNLSQQTWTATLVGGDRRQIEAGKTIRLAVGTKIDFGGITGEVAQ
jgi:Ca-activated chloride channel family protein